MSMLVNFSCVTTKIETVSEVPEIEFPKFPVVEESKFNEETNEVIISLDYWLQLARYKIDIEATEEYFER